MRILINGNLGYIGPIVVRHFRSAFPDVHIIGFDTGFFADSLINAKRFPDERVDTQIFGDVRKLPEEALEGVDAVIQLAAISNDPMGKEFEKATDEINAQAVGENAACAKAAGVKAFVFASSCSVYGAGDEEAKSEDSPLDPLTAYARSKIAAERALAPLADEVFKVTSLRFATACGFSPRLRLDLVLNDFVASAVAVRKIEILSDGTPWRPLIHVRDMARAMEWSITRSTESGNYLVVNVGSNSWNYRVRELAEAVKEQMTDVEISVNQKAARDMRSYRVDFGLFQKLAPEHHPKMTLQDAITDLIQGLRASAFSDANFRESIYMRLKVLRELQMCGRLSDDLFWKRQN